MKQILNYFDSITRMPSIGMDYMIIYFPPENRFPNNFFSNAYKAVNNPSHLSMDTFAYLNIDLPESIPDLPKGWTVRKHSQRHRESRCCIQAALRRYPGGCLMSRFTQTPRGIHRG